MNKVNYAELIGLPFVYGGRGPDQFDCYGLIMHLLKEEQGVEIPDYRSPCDLSTIAGIFDTEIKLWKRCDPIPGAVVMFRILGLGAHVGYVLENDQFIHTWEGSSGVIIERLSSWKPRVLGYYVYAGK